MELLTKNAYAKINLCLDVTGRRPNGYHDVDMVMQSIALCDRLAFEKTPGDTEIVCTNRKDLSCGSDNLIYKAVAAMKERYGFPGGVRVQLEKNIPIAAGLAGGSTDCAAALTAVNDLYGLNLSAEQLAEAAASLGADVPFCLIGGCARARGIGERLEPVAGRISPYLVLIKPDFGVSTAQVYGQFDSLHNVAHPDVPAMVGALERGDLDEVCGCMGNVLADVTMAMHPLISKLCGELREAGAKEAMMSGSGPTVFGVFAAKQQAREALERIRESRPDMFSCLTTFASTERGV